MAARFRIDQATPGTGVIDRTRTDLIPGEVITLVVPSPVGGATYTWEIVQKYGSTASLLATTGTSVTIGPSGSIGYFCGFLIKLTETIGTAVTSRKRIAAVRSQNKGLRPFLFGETANSSSTRASRNPDDSTDNETRTSIDGVTGDNSQNWAGFTEALNQTVAAVEAASTGVVTGSSDISSVRINVSGNGTLGVTSGWTDPNFKKAARIEVVASGVCLCYGMLADLTAGGMFPGKKIVNVGSGDLVLVHNSGSVSGGAQNKFSLPSSEGSSYTIKPEQSVDFGGGYNYTDQLWKKVADAEALLQGEAASAFTTKVGRRANERRVIALDASSLEWVGGDTTAAISGYIYGSTSSGRWYIRSPKQDTLERIVNRQGGALGTADDSAAILAALTAFKSYHSRGTIFIEGQYFANEINLAGTLFSELELIGRGWSTGFKQATGGFRLLSINAGTGGTSDPANNTKNVRFANFSLTGMTTPTFDEHNHLLNLNAITAFTAENLLIQGQRGDGVYVGSSNVSATERHNLSVVLSRLRIDGVNATNRNGITFIDCDGFDVSDCDILNTTQVGQPGSICLEPDAANDAFTVLRNGTIRKNRISGGNEGGITLNLRPQSLIANKHVNILVEDNVIKSKPSGFGFTGETGGSGATSSTPSYGVTLRRNHIENCATRGIYVNGASGVSLQDNHIKNCGSSEFGYDKINFGCEMVRDHYEGCGVTAVNGLIIRAFDTLVMDSVRFTDCGLTTPGAGGRAIQFQGTSTRLKWRNVVFESPTGRTTYAVQNTGTIDQSTSEEIGTRYEFSTNTDVKLPGSTKFTAAPTSGTWAEGSTVYNSNPAGAYGAARGWTYVNSQFLPLRLIDEGVLASTLTTRLGIRDGETVECSGVDASGSGLGRFRWWAGDNTPAVVGQVYGTNPAGRWKRDEPDQGYTPEQFGVISGVRNDAAWNNWLAAVCASRTKTGYLPAGTYLLGNAVNPITADGVTIRCARGAVVLYDQSVAATAGTTALAAFKATSRKNLRFEGLGFGAITSISLVDCEDVVIDGIRGDGNILSGVGTNRHWAYGIYLETCRRVVITNVQLRNFEFATYLSGSLLNRCKKISVSGSHFYKSTIQTLAFGQTTDFPVGIYVYYADDVTVTGSHFYNIRSCVSGGSRGTGMGYGIYEGDGACAGLTIGGCTFEQDTGDAYGMTGVYITTCKSLDLQPCTYRWNSTNANSMAIAGDFMAKDGVAPGAQRIKINAGSIDMQGGAQRYAIQVGTADASTYPLLLKVSGANVQGGRIQWAKNHTRNVALSIVENESYASPDAGIEILGNVLNVNPKIAGNHVEKATYSGISIAGSVRSIVLNNRVLDCNTANEGSDDGKYCGIVFPSFGYGATIKGNHIENRAGIGLMRRAIHAFSATQRFAWKYDDSNTSVGFPAGVPTMGDYFYQAQPVGGWDWRPGDRAYHAKPSIGFTARWRVEARTETTLGATLSASATVVTVASTANMGPGDSFQCVLSTTSLDADAGNPYAHFAGVIESITDATHLVLTAAVPAGYSFPSGSQASVIRWKPDVADGVINAKWFGLSVSASRAANTAAINAAISTAQSIGTNKVLIEAASSPYLCNPGISNNNADLTLLGEGAVLSRLDFGADASTPNLNWNVGAGNKTLQVIDLGILGGGTGVKWSGTSYANRNSTLRRVAIAGYYRSGFETVIEMTGCSFSEINFESAIVSNNVVTRGLYAHGSAVLHHTSWYNCRASQNSFAGFDLVYEGTPGDAGSEGAIFHQPICEANGYYNNFPRSSVVTVNGSAAITVPSTTDLVKGMAVTGTGIAGGSMVIAIASNTVTLDKPCTASGTITATFYGGFGFRLFSASAAIHGGYSEVNASNDYLVDTDYAGAAVTKPRLRLYRPQFDNAYDATQYQSAEDAYRRIAVVNHFAEISIHEAKVAQQSSRRVLFDLGGKIYGTYAMHNCDLIRYANKLNCFQASENRIGYSTDGVLPNDGAGGGSVALPTGMKETSASSWGAGFEVLATQWTASSSVAIAKYLITQKAYDGSGAVNVYYLGGTSDFMTFSVSGGEILFRSTNHYPCAIRILGTHA